MPFNRRSYLVFHQGDERRHYDCGSTERDCWQLVAQGLSVAGGHDHQPVPSSTDMLHDITLAWTEFGVAKVSVIELFEVHCCGFSVVATPMLSNTRTSPVRVFNSCRIAPKTSP